MSYRRFVALGDSTTEGLMDPLARRERSAAGRTGWPSGWPQDEPDLRYANLAVRGKLARQVREEQLEPALALEPDLVSLLAGLNDMLRRNVDVAAVIGELDGDGRALRDAGADVLAFTLPDPVPINPLAKPRRRCVRAPERRDPRDLGRARGEVPGRPRGARGLLRPPAVERATACTRTRKATAGSRAAAAEALGLPDADTGWTAAFADPLGPPLAPLPRGLVGALPHAVADPAAARRLLRRRARGQAPGRSSRSAADPARPDSSRADLPRRVKLQV